MMIREFEKGDKNGVQEVLREVWKITEIKEETLSTWMKSNYNFVAIEDGDVIGVITLHTQIKLIRDGGIAGFIEEVAVKEKHRGKGIGKMLVDKALEKALEIGCYKVVLSCFPERIKFYERCGFYNESTLMRINLR